MNTGKQLSDLIFDAMNIAANAEYEMEKRGNRYGVNTEDVKRTQKCLK